MPEADSIIQSLVPFIKENIIILLPPMVLVTIAIQIVRDTWAKIFGESEIVDGSTKDRARAVILFLLPFVFSYLYLLGISGSWLANGKYYTVKQYIFGTVALGVINTFLYRYFFKPYMFAWIKAKLAAKFGQP